MGNAFLFYLFIRHCQMQKLIGAHVTESSVQSVTQIHTVQSVPKSLVVRGRT